MRMHALLTALSAILVLLLDSSHARGSAPQQVEPVGSQFHDDYPTVAEIPEPMVFDLVRRLGSLKGELEVNVLTRIEGSTRPGDLLFAPEIEYAILDGFALELELPFEGSTLESVKGAAQLTFGLLGRRDEIIHGTQLLYERSVHDQEADLMALYLLGHRLGRLSYLAMLGPMRRWATDGSASYGGVFNLSWFYNSTREVDLGLELNWMGPNEEFRELRLMPQLHLLFAGEWKVQVGTGLLARQGRIETTSAFRIIKEFN